MSISPAEYRFQANEDDQYTEDLFRCRRRDYRGDLCSGQAPGEDTCSGQSLNQTRNMVTDRCCHLTCPVPVVRCISSILLKGTGEKHGESRFDLNSGLGLADDPRTSRRSRRIFLLSLRGVQKRPLPDHEKSVAQYNLWGDTGRNVRCTLTTRGQTPPPYSVHLMENNNVEEPQCCKPI